MTRSPPRRDGRRFALRSTVVGHGGGAIGRLAVCALRGETFARPLEWSGSRVRLVSPNERYAPIEASEAELQLVGVVVGRLAEIA